MNRPKMKHMLTLTTKLTMKLTTKLMTMLLSYSRPLVRRIRLKNIKNQKLCVTLYLSTQRPNH